MTSAASTTVLLVVAVSCLAVAWTVLVAHAERDRDVRPRPATPGSASTTAYAAGGTLLVVLTAGGAGYFSVVLAAFGMTTGRAVGLALVPTVVVAATAWWAARTHRPWVLAAGVVLAPAGWWCALGVVTG